ncbi:MAG: hypothetical protein HYV27_01135 [Candidatus Hydrogenedentes bacterium]|nr:hypothetical protein [Candidatus Hydrogenedentota bacterium]
MVKSAKSTSTAGEPQGLTGWVKDSGLQLGAVIVQVILITLVFHAVRLESQAFRQVLLIAAAAFPVHHLLPLRFRLPFFVLLSLGTIITIIGAASAAWLIGIGMVFIGLCHVPASMNVRLGLVTLAAIVLAVFRADWISAPWPSTIWPILGAMFMFRLIVYLYDLAHKSAPFSPWRSLAYFFMTPNICFPLFPVVDYQTFCRTYYNDNPCKIYQTGIKWMLRGAIQLIVYRFIYMFMIVDPADIEGASGFFQHMVFTYLLYLKVSGTFHTIIGLLHLFGFNLPETNHHYVLASSFTDFWRRINIYWKDFMMKVFFYPLFFRLRKRGAAQGLILATLIAFFATWALHAYQWYWLRGAFLFTLQDIIFWVVLGILVTVSVWNESRSKKKMVPKTTLDSARLAVVLAAKTVATFLTITFLWSLWTSDSVGEWQATLLQLGKWDGEAFLKIALALGALSAAAIIVGRDQWMIGAAARQRAAKGKVFDFWRGAAVHGATSVFIVAMALSEVQSYMNPTLVAVLDALENPSLNTQDAAVLQRGYYEDLMRVDRFNAELQAMYNKQPKEYFVEWRQAMNTQREDYLGVEITPSASIVYKEESYTTNEWGMRDKPYTKEKPDGVRRIGMIGSSHIMGWGVSDREVCEALVEDRLNKEGLAYELLNFSVNGYDPIQKAIVLEERMLDFGLDAAFMFCHRIEKQWIIAHLVQRVKSGREFTDPFVLDILKKANVSQEMDESVLKIRLSNYGSELLDWSLKRFADSCRKRGVTSVWIYMPEKGRISFSDRDIKEIFASAENAGFDLILDYSGAYKGYSDAELSVSDFDDHPNDLSHRLLADRIYETMKSNEALFGGASQAQAAAASNTQ